MKNDNLPGLTPAWLIILATVLGILITVAVPAVLGPDGIKASDWLGFAGNVLTAGVAAVAIYFAWKGIANQLSVSLMSREEDRIEAELPGLRQAAELLRTLEFSSDAADILYRMEVKNLIVEGDFKIEDLRKLLPDLQDRSLRIIYSKLDRIMLQAQLVEQSVSSLNRLDLQQINDLSFPPEAIEQRKRMREMQQRQLARNYNSLQRLLDELKAISKGIELRVTRLTELQLKFRNEIEKHFDAS